MKLYVNDYLNTLISNFFSNFTEQNSIAMTKTILLLTSLLLLGLQSSFAQIELGIRGGIVSNNFNIKDHSSEIDDITNGDKEVGFHIGALIRITSSTEKFIFELDPTFVNTKSTFQLTDNSSILNKVVIEDKNWRMDVPIMFGTRFAGFLDLMAGPSLSLNIGSDLSYDSVSETIDQEYKSTTWGYQVGAGFKIAKFIIDVRYAGSLESVTDGIKIGDTVYDTDARPNALFASLTVLL